MPGPHFSSSVCVMVRQTQQAGPHGIVVFGEYPIARLFWCAARVQNFYCGRYGGCCGMCGQKTPTAEEPSDVLRRRLNGDLGEHRLDAVALQWAALMPPSSSRLRGLRCEA